MARWRTKAVVAEKVRAEFVRLLDKKPSKEWNRIGHIEHYVNGNEQGYCLKVNHNSRTFSVAFAENQHDDIVVYAGIGRFNPEGNIPDDEARLNRKSFPPAHEKAAAEYIIQQIEKFLS
jgi:hypothetical protein